jgi:RNA polymerase sigma factor (sigma-70 family)
MKFRSEKRKDPVSFLKEIMDTGKLRGQRYDEKRVRFLLLWYRRTQDERYRTEIIEMCYPLVFTILRKLGKRFNTENRIFNNDDLFSESVLVIERCIKGYKFRMNVKFITFVYISILRNARRFLGSHLVQPSKVFVSSIDVFNDTNEAPKEEKYVKYESALLDRDILDCLTYKERTIVRLRERDVSVEKICKLMKIKQGTYYRRMRNIRAKVRKEMGHVS